MPSHEINILESNYVFQIGKDSVMNSLSQCSIINALDAFKRIPPASVTLPPIGPEIDDMFDPLNDITILKYNDPHSLMVSQILKGFPYFVMFL